MRFEIKTGGAILILIGLAGLSLVVFALGLFAGYDMARNTAPEAPQTASVYSPPSPPPEQAKVSAPANEIAPAPSAKTASNAKAASASTGNASSLSMDKNAGPVASAPRAVANAPVPAPKLSSARGNSSELSSEDADTDGTPPPVKPSVSKAASVPPAKYASTASDAAGGHHKPFNIQIDAVMDRPNAEQMTARLQKLGYRAFMVPTNISGQVWWRVRVGPYDSQEQASTAEQELRAKYKESYTP